MSDLVYDALATAPGLRPDGAWVLMFVVAVVQAIFLLPALIVLGSMRARPWTAARNTTLAAFTGKQFLTFLLAAGIFSGPAISVLFLLITGRHTISRGPFASAACLGVLTFYPALAAFRSMIPGARGDIGDGPPYQVAARGPAFGLLAIGLISAPLVAGGLIDSISWEELRSSLARGEFLTATGTLGQVGVRTVEIHARNYVRFEEHDVFTLGGNEIFEAVCMRKTKEILADTRSYTCLRAAVGDRLTVGYRDISNPRVPSRALKIWQVASMR